MSGTYDIAKIKAILTNQQTLYKDNTNIQTQIDDVMKDIGSITPKIKIKDDSGKIVETSEYDPVKYVTNKLAAAHKKLKDAKSHYDKIHKAAKKILKKHNKIQDAINKDNKITKISKHQKKPQSKDAAPSKASKK